MKYNMGYTPKVTRRTNATSFNEMFNKLENEQPLTTNIESKNRILTSKCEEVVPNSLVPKESDVSLIFGKQIEVLLIKIESMKSEIENIKPVVLENRENTAITNDNIESFFSILSILY
jgi:hypothetical protein